MCINVHQFRSPTAPDYGVLPSGVCVDVPNHPCMHLPFISNTLGIHTPPNALSARACAVSPF